jgi:hypothetical protein
MVAVLFLGFGAVLAAGGVYRYRRSRAFLAGAVRVSGVVVRTHPVRSTDSFEYFPVLRFRTAEGLDVETVGQTNGGSFELMRLHGRQVGVYYDPADPRLARLDTNSGRALSGSVGMVVAGLVFAAIGVASLVVS